MKKKHFILSALLVVFLLGFGAFRYTTKSTITKKWETAKAFKTPESVCYDAERDKVYVANINGKPTEKDGNGFISKISTAGKFILVKWMDGLNAPKGMGVLDDKLYVTDIDEVVEIDIEKNAIVNRYAAENAKFLNDISIDKNDEAIYVSDMLTNTIYVVKDGNISVFMKDDDKLYKPNGLFVSDNTLLVGLRNSVAAIDLDTKNISTYITETGGIDGLVATGTGEHYLISDWSGRIHIIHPDKEKVKMLDMTNKKINAADIEFIPKKNLLLIPTFYDNRVLAYEIIVE